MATIRELVEGAFGPDAVPRIFCETSSYFDVPVKSMRLGSSEMGALQCTCGGDVIMCFVPENAMRQPLYIVRDDRDEEAWLNRRQSHMLEHGTDFGFVGQTGPCPHARLRLVQSA